MPDLFRASPGGKVHLANCPHLLDTQTPLLPIPEGEEVELQMCQWCQAEIDGEGRTYCDTIEQAMEEIEVPQSNRTEIARLLRLVEYDAVYVPFSRSYLTLQRGGRAVAWTGKHRVEYADDRPSVTLPSFAEGGGGGGSAKRDQPWGETCERCFMQRSLAGVCGCE